jgi:hypothetical protein
MAGDMVEQELAQRVGILLWQQQTVGRVRRRSTGP